MRPEPYIFDFDGTLVDSMPTWGGKMLHVLDKNGVTYPILRYVRAFDSLQTGYVPTTVILDGTGSIVCKPFSGSMNYASWCALVEELL